MTAIVVAVVILAIVAAAGLYIYKAKKNGKKCIGCPYAGSCSGGCGGNK
jgi:radical SAM protein with 4Fe4S-binding SPASM domain